MMACELRVCSGSDEAWPRLEDREGFVKTHIIALGLALAGALQAAEISFSQPFSLGPGETAFALQLNQFNPDAYPATPVLESVKVTIEVTFSGGMTFFNQSFGPISASGSIGNARVRATPIGSDLLTPPDASLGLSAAAVAVGPASMSPDPDPANSPPDPYQIDGEASLTPETAASPPPSISSSAAAALAAYSGTGYVQYDVDFTALYPPIVIASPETATCILANERVTGEIVVTYTAKSSPPTSVVLESFGASWSGPGLVLLNWRTGVESNLIGFVLERQLATTAWLQVSDGLIPALGGGQPNDYRFEEADVASADVVRYRLSGVNTQGVKAALGETVVQPGITAGIELTETGLKLNVQGAANTRVTIEETADVAHGPWVPTSTIALDASGAGTATLPVSDTEPARFYRLIQE